MLSFHLNSDGCFMTYTGQRWLSWPLCDVTYGTSTWTRNSWAAAAVVQDQKRRRRRRRSFGCLRTFPCKGLGFFLCFPIFRRGAQLRFSEGVLSVYLFRNSHYVDEPMLRYEAVSPMWCGGSRGGLQHRVCVQLPEHRELKYLINSDAHISRHVD